MVVLGARTAGYCYIPYPYTPQSSLTAPYTVPPTLFLFTLGDWRGQGGESYWASEQLDTVTPPTPLLLLIRHYFFLQLRVHLL